MPIGQQHAARPTTGRRHPKELLLLYRASQLDCNNEYAWGSRAFDSDYEWGLQIEQQVEQLLDSSFEQPPELEEQPELPEFNPLLIGPPPGLGLACAVSNPVFEKDDAPKAMTTDAMLASCGRENISCEAAFAGLVNPAATLPMNAQTTPKNGLHICLADCIDDTSTAASENSPLLFPRDLIDAGSAHSSPMHLKGPVQKDSPRTVPSLEGGLPFAPKPSPTLPSLEEALTFAPKPSPTLPSLEQALNFAPKPSPKPASLPSLAEALALETGSPRVARKGSQPISLDAMLDFNSGAKNATTLQESSANEDALKSSQAPLGMAPNTMPMWWWSNFYATNSPSSNPSNSLMSTGFPNTTALWQAAAWSRRYHVPLQ